jgi:hypothetical protein
MSAATLAQLAEQRFCKAQVAGSIPAGGFALKSTGELHVDSNCGFLPG